MKAPDILSNAVLQTPYHTIHAKAKDLETGPVRSAIEPSRGGPLAAGTTGKGAGGGGIPSAWMIRSVVSWKASRPPSCCIRRTRKLCSVFWGRWVSSISSQGVVPEQIELQLF